MDTEYRKIAVACFLGAFIGALVALQANPYLWWVGMLVGAVVGYVAYDFKKIPTTAKQVWQKIPKRGDLYTVFKLWFERSWYSMCFGFFPWSIIGFTLFVIVLGNLNLLALVTHQYLPLIGQGPGLLIFSLGATFYLAFFSWVFSRPEDGSDQKKYWQFRFAFLLPVAFSPLFAPVAWIATGIIIICVGIWAGFRLLKFTLHFAWETFKLVHSDMRLLCMVDSAIGATIGYFAGNAWLGGIAGVAFGLANYELVSRRLLKLVIASPSR